MSTVDKVVEWLSFVNFRNANALGPLVIQCCMIVSSLLVLAGLTYVGILVICITIHHFTIDRDPKRIPDYVRRSIQFDSDTDESEDEDYHHRDSGMGSGSFELEESDDSTNKRFPKSSKERRRSDADPPSTTQIVSRKGANRLDMFLNSHMDVDKHV